jgi:hypothetical protein
MGSNTIERTTRRQKLCAAGLLSEEEAEAGEDVEMIFMPCRSESDWIGQSRKQGHVYGLFPADARLDSLN